ncbi:MAG: hypothetical protein HY600_06095 [Candidatus Omnitrophica bacterium]|nr:hypothetical protein [Candidatus Omnitrophota bacterium]
MKPAPWRTVLILGLMAAFVAVGVGAVLPHSHENVPAGHDCVFCRAHSTPVVEAPALIVPAQPDHPAGLVEAHFFALGAQPSVATPFGRAPPLFS